MSSRPPLSKTKSKSRARPRSSEDGSKGIWSSMLDGVATGRRLAEKTVLVLGGTPESQRELLDTLSQDPSQQRRRTLDRNQTSKPQIPIANRFALGYTYQDILDEDQDDTLARLSLFLLADSHPAFSPLLGPLFTSKTVPDMLVVILLDWATPWFWLRQLRDWIRVLRSVLDKADGGVKDAMDENMKAWRERRKGSAAVSTTDPAGGEAAGAGDTSGTSSNSAMPALALGPGEWDEPLGVPVCVVCQNAEKIEILEREHGWKDREFDCVLQHLRTVLLKHGASLIYTASTALQAGPLQTLVRSSLDVHSLLQKNPLKHNVVDRDKVLIPPNWDSWGKIRVLCEGFDAEGVSSTWSIDIQVPAPASRTSDAVEAAANGNVTADGYLDSPISKESSAVLLYEEAVPNPNAYKESQSTAKSSTNGIDVTCEDLQPFLAEQSEILERLRAEDAQSEKAKAAKKPTYGAAATQARDGDTAKRVDEHIGPVQFNMGGIQVDADDMLRSLREREAGRAANEADAGDDDTSGPSSPGANAASDGNFQTDKLNAFFAGLASRGMSSASSSPK